MTPPSYQPYPPPQWHPAWTPPPPKRPVWPYVVAAVAVFLVLVLAGALAAVLTSGGSEQPSAAIPSAASSAPPPPSPSPSSSPASTLFELCQRTGDISRKFIPSAPDSTAPDWEALSVDALASGQRGLAQMTAQIATSMRKQDWPKVTQVLEQELRPLCFPGYTPSATTY